jgi:hypothetical protein
VDEAELSGVGFAVTLTVRDLPASAREWAAARRAFLMRMDRLGLVRGQWLTEWQRRGVPHMHGVLFFPEGSVGLQEAVRRHWLEAAAEWCPGASSQVVLPLWGLSGWGQYQAKHSARGIGHVQRRGMPPGWESSGRLWGVVGDWPTREEVIEVPTAAFWRFRRHLRSYRRGYEWRLSRDESRPAARRWESELRRRWLRGLLRDPERARSAVRGVGEWVPEAVARRLLAAAELRDERREFVDLGTGEVVQGFVAWERALFGRCVPLPGPGSSDLAASVGAPD